MDIKSFEGMLDAVYDAEPTKSGGSWKFTVKVNGEYYTMFDKDENLIKEQQKLAKEAQADNTIVKFEYEIKGDFKNIFGLGNWKGEPGEKPTLDAKPKDTDSDVTKCVRDAREAWSKGVYGTVLGEFNPSDLEAIQKIAVSLMIARRIK